MSLPDQVVAELQKEYLESLPAIIAEIRAAIESSDWENIEKHFHRLAGSGQTYGLPDITTVGRQMEAYLQANSPHPSASKTKEALMIFEKIVENYRKNLLK